MKKKQLLTALITHYEKAIDRIEYFKNITTARNIITLFAVNLGVCHTAKTIFKVDVYEKRWVDRHIDRTEHKSISIWADYPEWASTTETILSLLQIRVDIMEKELKRKWWHLF